MGASALNAWHSLAEWQADAARILADEALAIADVAMSTTIPGLCALCGSREGFVHVPGAPSEYREGLTCRQCQCIARQRAAAMLLFDALQAPLRARVYITEQASALYMALRRRLPRLRGSEFEPSLRKRARLSLWLFRQGVPTWVACQDVTSLRARDASLDAVLTLDVLEHVPQYALALGEFARVLRPGAPLLLSVPFYDASERSETIARLRTDGSIEHFGTPEFHGDPLGGGVPCFHHFGWDLLAAMRDAGFADASAVRVQDPAYGLPQGQWMLRAVR